MAMKYYTIDKNSWDRGVEKIKESYRTFGPVKEKQGFHLFRELQKGEEPDLTCSNTRLSPKGLVYPQSQTLFTYTLDEKQADSHILKEAQPDGSERAVLGIRPCDAKAFRLVKMNFDTPDYKDPYWLNAYEKTVFVGFACDSPCGTCFCTTAGSGPYHEEGLDLLLFKMEDRFIAKSVTEKGERLAEIAGWKSAADGIDLEKRLQERKKEAEGKIRSFVETDRLKQIETTKLYDAPFWEEAAFSCINCGTCTYVCPTCWCFDIQDENRKQSGKRMRNWDSCMFPLFTLHGSGHNPRGSKTHRVRQRFMHKLKYFQDKYDAGIQCVGCGRCIRLCPVNIDIREICRRMNDANASACACQTP